MKALSSIIAFAVLLAACSQEARQFVDSVVEVAGKYSSDRVKAFGVKLHTEGNFTSKTALMLEPYFRGGEPIENPT